ncbi:uncharacterized protein HD556DRAFT_1308297 [Suillus plorans]|uniref:Uncharacterized protein n=1 Tax=Suillus plorans TaxID=116603 RepID=A0A9P7DH93_9AGAM|nr:uncharacterized protein HD556DRAFT_1308297 [Suillus plorans]KAG1794248.1 hypothetical protein HD556DRAFT_1308297 [Suillus plorans]
MSSAGSLTDNISIPAQECTMWVQNATSQLLSESEFLWFGLDVLYNCVLNGLIKNSHSKSYSKFFTKEYGLIYRQMVRMMNQILQHPYHGPRAACLKLNGTEKTKHTHLQIILD